MLKLFHMQSRDLQPVEYGEAWPVESLPSTRRPEFDPRRNRNFKFYPGTECVSFVCVLSSTVSGGGTADTVLTTHSGMSATVFLFNVLVHSLLFPLQASDSWAFGS